jgi:hypothetical protein
MEEEEKKRFFALVNREIDGTVKKYNTTREIICVCKKRPHLDKSKRESKREKQHT